MQFGINGTSEWLLIAQGEAECNYAIQECMLLIPNCMRKHAIVIANHKLCQVDSILHKYEYVYMR